MKAVFNRWFFEKKIQWLSISFAIGLTQYHKKSFDPPVPWLFLSEFISSSCLLQRLVTDRGVNLPAKLARETPALWICFTFMIERKTGTQPIMITNDCSIDAQRVAMPTLYTALLVLLFDCAVIVFMMDAPMVKSENPIRMMRAILRRRGMFNDQTIMMGNRT